MKRVPKGALFVLAPDSPVAARIASGETVCIEVEDAFRGMIRQAMAGEELLRICTSLRELSCPLSGPLYVEGAEKGDVLRVHIDDIACGPYGVSILGADFCRLPGDVFPSSTAKVVDVRDGKLLLDDGLCVDVSPMIGTILACQAEEREYSWRQGAYGGNMDCRYIAKGADVFLPVQVEGALLALGDCHARQGDGEVVNPLEIPAVVTLTPTVLKKPLGTVSCPCVETEDLIVTVVSDKPFEVAGQKAARQMLAWLEEGYGMSRERAGLLCATVGDIRVCQISGTLYTACCTMPKAFLARSDQ